MDDAADLEFATKSTVNAGPSCIRGLQRSRTERRGFVGRGFYEDVVDPQLAIPRLFQQHKPLTVFSTRRHQCRSMLARENVRFACRQADMQMR